MKTIKISEINYEHLSLNNTLKTFHQGIPMDGNPPNALLSLPDELLTYLIAAIRNAPHPAPDVSHDDWENFLALLRPHWIIPLIAFHIRTWPEECLPPQEIMEFLNRVLLMASARSLLAGKQIQLVTDALKNAGIPVILLKGPALARTVYPDPLMRQSGDIDLLVKPEDVIKCERVFADIGYTCIDHSFHTSPHTDHHQIFYPPNSGMSVELHWVADGNYSLFERDWIDTAFEQKIPVQSYDLSCFTLNHVHHLQFLAYHNLLKHDTIRMDMICDTVNLMKKLRFPEDWEILRSTSVKNHIRIPLEYLLIACNLWSGYEIPYEYRDFFSWPAPSLREKLFWKFIRHKLISNTYYDIQKLPNNSEKCLYIYHFILSPPELLTSYRKSSSPADIPLAHLRRWFSIVKYR